MIRVFDVLQYELVLTYRYSAM